MTTIVQVSESERVEIASELIAALQRSRHEQADNGAAGAMTTAELSEELGWCNDRVRAMLRVEISAGQVEPCRVRRPTISGSYHRVPAYRFVGGRGADDA